MKKRVNITISDEALTIADQSGNRSEFIENLITLGNPPIAEGGEVMEALARLEVKLKKIEELLKQPTSQPTKQTPADTFVPKPPDPELGYPCCQKNSPCKHWVWDGVEGLWKNTLTLKTREL
jgi:hypothetical protein